MFYYSVSITYIEFPLENIFEPMYSIKLLDIPPWKDQWLNDFWKLSNSQYLHSYTIIKSSNTYYNLILRMIIKKSTKIVTIHISAWQQFKELENFKVKVYNTYIYKRQ